MTRFFQSLIKIKDDSWRRHLADWLIVLSGLGFSQGSVALILIIAARRVSPGEYGQYIACYSLLSLLVVMPKFGLDLWILSNGESAKSGIYSSWVSAFKLMLFLLFDWLILIFFLAKILPSSIYRFDLLVTTAVGMVCDSLILLTYNTWRVKKGYRRVSLFQIASSIILFITILIYPFSVGQIVIFSVIRSSFSLLLLVSVFLSTIKGKKAELESLPFKWLLRKSFPFVLGDVATAVYLKADLTIVAFFLGAVGASIYGPALSMTNFLYMIPNALYFIVVPSLSRQYRISPYSFNKLGLNQVIIQAVFGMILSLFVFKYGPLIIQLTYGSAYQLSGVVFRLMSPLLLIKSLNFGLGAIITAGDFQKWRTTIQVISASFNLVANLLVVTSLGILGVVIVYLLSEIILLIGYLLTMLSLRSARV